MSLPEREITECHAALHIRGDEFRKGLRYTNWRPRGSGDFLLIQTVSGGGLIGWGNDFITTQPGDVLLYEPQSHHDYVTDPDVAHWHLVWAHFLPPPRMQEWLAWPEIGPGIHHVPIHDKENRQWILKALRQVVRQSRNPGRIAEALAWNALEEVLIRVSSALPSEQKQLDERIQKGLHWLETNPGKFTSVDQLARHSGLSTSRFAHLFQKETGMSPARFAEVQRLLRAAGLLRMTQLQIGEIAVECGYENGFYFSNRFRKFYGKSPTEYRTLGGQTHPRTKPA